ncbi:MAG: hypothetical protein R2708_01775 [Vicinamibacterales bacterium]
MEASERRRSQAQDERESPTGQDEPGHGAQPTEKQRFRQVLAGDAQRAGAERALHRRLARPYRRARDQQRADVDAGDEQQDRGAGAQHDQRTTHVVHGIDGQRHRLELPAGGAIESMRRRDLPTDACDVGEGIGLGHP